MVFSLSVKTTDDMKKVLLYILFGIALLPFAYGQSSGSCPGLHNPTGFSGWYGKIGARVEGISTSTNIRNTTAFIDDTIYRGNYLAVLVTPAPGSGNIAKKTRNTCALGSNPDNNNRRFQIITTPGYDANTGGVLPRIPENATTSIRIGDMWSNSYYKNSDQYSIYTAEALFYEMTITPENALVLIDYAIVMESPTHGQIGNPEFIIRISKKVNNQWQNAPLNDSLYYIVQAPDNNNQLPAGEWERYRVGQCSFVYKPWEKAAINLENFLYEDIRIEIYMSDCTSEYHGAYCYISGSCQSMRLKVCKCGYEGEDIAIIHAPKGLISYIWQRKNASGNWENIPGATDSVYNVQLTDFYIDANTNTYVKNNDFRCIMTSALDPAKPIVSYVEANISVNRGYNDTIYAEICPGMSYTENGFDTSEPGTYTQHLYSTQCGNCDSIVTLVLDIKPTPDSTIYDTICANERYTENGFDVNETGIYLDTLQAANGCDSTVTLNLTVIPTLQIIYDTIRENEVYDDNGFHTDTPGIYSDTLQAACGCDSVVQLNLVVIPLYDTILDDTICGNEVYTANGFNVNVAGVYIDTIQTSSKLDSIVRLNLVVNTAYDTVIFDTICSNEPYNENGFDNINISGIHTIRLQTINGCDSTIQLNLLVYPARNDTINATIKEGEYYTEHGFLEYQEGFYSQHYTSRFGCDSSIVLNLMVLEEPTLWVGNCITPLGNSNQTFAIQPGIKIIVDDVYIYNRTGILIFRSEHNTEAWDGKYKGNYCPQGTYTYAIYYHTTLAPNEKKIKTGTFVLLY